MSTRLSEIEANCKKLGIPFTLQRRAVAESLFLAKDHPTADEVFARVSIENPGIARATVFRTLETFVEHGMARRIAHPGSVARYDGKVTRHHHLVCDGCGMIRDLEDNALDAIPLPDVTARGFQVADFSVNLRGLCATCSLTDPKTN